MNPRISVAAVIWPVTLEECKAQLNITVTDDDTYLTRLFKAATRLAENVTGQTMLTTTWTFNRDAWPSTDVFELQFGPVKSITSIKYFDDDGVQQTWDSSNFRLSGERLVPRVQAVDGFPSAQARVDAVEVIYVAGETSEATFATTNEDIKSAILLFVGDMYKQREDISNLKIDDARPFFEDLLIPHKLVTC